MNNHKIIFLVLAITLLSLLGCKEVPKTTSEKIDALKHQVEADAMTLQNIENKDFTLLQDDFKYCDSMLQFLSTEQVDAGFEKLNLTQAYLQQFAEVKPIMVSKMNYVVAQLDNLKTDLVSQYVSDSLAIIYLADESRVADTLHEQVLYFQDRFGKCQRELNTLKKSWK